MPEQLTRHPEVTLEVLRGAGAACGTGAPQRILTKCPAERFCSLPTGELCIYGLDEVPKMTQISARDLAAASGPAPGALPDLSTWLEVLVLVVVLLLGIAVGALWRRSRAGKDPSTRNERT